MTKTQHTGKIFLSPAQHKKPCLVEGCSEAAHANAIADAMERWLTAAGLSVLRNDPETEVPMNHVRRANAWGAELYIALHTNGGGGKRCTVYNAGTAESEELSRNLARAYGEIYPHSLRPSDTYPVERCRASWTELTHSQMPAVYCELWFHDHAEDAAWGHDHIEETGYALACGVCDHLGRMRPSRAEASCLPEREKIARVVAAEARGEPLEGQRAVAQCIHDRWKDEAQRFGKSLEAVLGGFAAPWTGELRQTTCLQAVADVFDRGYRVYKEPCLWCLGHKAGEAIFAERHARYRFLGQIGKQYFWGDEKQQEEPLLLRGCRGEAVRRLQKRLMQLGYALPRFGADAVFGSETEVAVRLFQKVAGCTVDGIVGDMTWEALQDARSKTEYIVKRGDTLSAIARQFDTTVRELVRINALHDPDRIHPGQKLIVA